MSKDDFIFISPHRDDVCFSVGALASLTGGTLINVFTRSQYTIETVADYSPDTIKRVSLLRQSEDAAFMALSNLVEIDLGLSEAPLRGYHPFARDDLDSEGNIVEPQLHLTLEAFSRPMARLKPWLLCPMGIGGHRDHIIVRNAVLNRLTELENGFYVAFYEDLHYASQPKHRQNGVAEFVDRLGRHEFRRTALPLGGRAGLKLEMVRLYASQFDQSPRDLCEFTPAVPGIEPHEAIWARREISHDWRVRLRVRGCNRP